ncbi:hypothetical protein [Streptococcus ferus]|uniref:hypothetical protein n=1 Tax=Streptococcus ferus TaxID=1345 RepID=UPI0035A16CA9
MNSEIITTLISVGASSFISIIGFVITNTSLKKSFKNEMRKSRDNVALEKMSTMPYEILELWDDMMEIDKVKSLSQKSNKQKENLAKFKRIMNVTYSYGSENVIKIVALMQKENYEAENQQIEQDVYRMASTFVLLTTQIKYDVTEIAVSPSLWFQMRLKDYTDQEELYKKANNQLVDELNLNNEFKI